MPIDIDKIRAETEGEWDLDVRIPKLANQGEQKVRPYPGVLFQVGIILEAAANNQTFEREALTARDKKTGKFLCRIGLEDYEVVEQGFKASGIGYIPWSGAPQKKKNNANGALKSDPYFSGSPATQFWHAVRS